MKDDVNFEDNKIIVKEEDKNLYCMKTKMTRVSKTNIEPKEFNIRQIFHLYNIHRIAHNRLGIHAYMPLKIMYCVHCHIECKTFA